MLALASDASSQQAAALRRAAQREARVLSGLAELDRWLCDQVRPGLAASQRAGYAHWDDIAARMIDAQASGLAERLRALAAVPHSGPGWDGRLLEEYALLRLLATAYRDQEKLPPDLRDTVRTRIGFTVRQADLLAGATPVSDHWSVLAWRDLDQDRIRTRRIWLYGQRTGRPALVLSFAAAGQSLDDSLGIGTEADADLIFYPAAVPLRALVAARHGAGPACAARYGRRGPAGRVRGRPRPGPVAGHLARRPAGHPGPPPAALPVGRRGRRPAAAPGGGRLLAAVRPVRRPPADGGRRVDPARPVAPDRLGRRRDGGTAVSEPEGRGAAWTEERRRSDEGRRHLTSAPAASGETL